jgi:hypothetical protein
MKYWKGQNQAVDPDNMANEFAGGRPTRRYERVTGPFDGRLEGPVLVYDLNLGGCFVNSSQEPVIGAVLVLTISLPHEGQISVNAETLYRHQHGFAVRFVDLDGDTAARIARTVDALKRRR